MGKVRDTKEDSSSCSSDVSPPSAKDQQEHECRRRRRKYKAHGLAGGFGTLHALPYTVVEQPGFQPYCMPIQAAPWTSAPSIQGHAAPPSYMYLAARPDIGPSVTAPLLPEQLQSHQHSLLTSMEVQHGALPPLAVPHLVPPGQPDQHNDYTMLLPTASPGSNMPAAAYTTLSVHAVQHGNQEATAYSPTNHSPAVYHVQSPAPAALASPQHLTTVVHTSPQGAQFVTAAVAQASTGTGPSAPSTIASAPGTQPIYVAASATGQAQPVLQHHPLTQTMHGAAASASPSSVAYSLSLTPLPVQLQYDTTSPQYPGTAASPAQVAASNGSQVLYDASSGVLLSAGQGNDVLLQELVAAGHKLQPAHTACCAKTTALQAALNGRLQATRSRLLRQLAQSELRAGEVRAAAQSIAQRTHGVMTDMLERLSAAESRKLCELNSQQSQLRAELDLIEGVVSRVLALCSSALPADAFLPAAGALLQECTRLSAKDTTASLDIRVDDLPCEAASLQDLSQANAALADLLKVKDAMIWQLLKERDQLQAHTRSLAAAYTQEVEEMDKEAQLLKERLQEQLAVNTAAGLLQQKLVLDRRSDGQPAGKGFITGEAEHVQAAHELNLAC